MEVNASDYKRGRRMIILDIPNWMLYASWFVFINFTIVIVAILWLVFLNKRDIRKELKK